MNSILFLAIFCNIYVAMINNTKACMTLFYTNITILNSNRTMSRFS